MAHLPYKERDYHTVDIRERWGKVKTYKIPHELTVEEVERLLEISERVQRLQESDLHESKAVQLETLKIFWTYIFAQVTILFQHHQPDITEKYLRKHLSDAEALKIVKFFDIYRDYQPDVSDTDGVKKKSNELQNLRHTMAFCVNNGFSLLEIRKLYIDEFFQFYFELVHLLEKKGELKEGAYDKVQGIDRSAENFRKMFSHFT